jgi:hypothetical protein
MNWQEIAVDIYNNYRSPKVLVGVHPTYGIGGQLVDETVWQNYQLGFINYWNSHSGPKVLIPTNRNKDYYFAPYPDYEITTFPSGVSSVRLPLIILAGATAKRGLFGSKGCVDLVADGLIDGGFAKKILISKQATLYP